MNSQIGQIERNAFDDLASLVELNLAHNNLSSLPHDLFTPLKFLVELHLHHNPWNCGCDSLWLARWLREYIPTNSTVLWALSLPCTHERPPVGWAGPGWHRGNAVLCPFYHRCPKRPEYFCWTCGRIAMSNSSHVCCAMAPTEWEGSNSCIKPPTDNRAEWWDFELFKRASRWHGHVYLHGVQRGRKFQRFSLSKRKCSWAQYVQP